MINVRTYLQPRHNIYKVYIDGELFCWTENDDDGLKLQIAVAKLELIKKQANAIGLEIVEDLIKREEI